MNTAAERIARYQHTITELYRDLDNLYAHQFTIALRIRRRIANHQRTLDSLRSFMGSK